MSNLQILDKKVINPKLDKEKSKELTGYPHIDKPWLKYYSKQAQSLEIPKKTIYEFISESISKSPNDVAISYFKNPIKYKQLLNKIDTIASSFTESGVKKGDIVTIMLPNTPENAISLYALNKIGAIANFVDLRTKDDELLGYLKEAESKLVIATDMFLENLTEVINETKIEKVIVASPADSLPPVLKQLYKLKAPKPNLLKNYQLWKDFEKQGKKNPTTIQEKYNPNQETCILHTSGTTGDPKGVMLTNENLNSMVLEYKHSGLDFSAGETFFNQIPPFLAYNIVLATHLPLSLNLKVIMNPNYEPEKFAENITKNKIQHAVAGPADWVNFLEYLKTIETDPKKTGKRKPNYKPLKTLASGSDKFPQEKKDEINQLLGENGCENLIIEGYGMTEASSAACTNLPQCNVPNSVGIPLPLMDVCIYDNDKGEPLKYNQEGEVCIGGATVMKGYFQSPEETAEVLKRHSDGKLRLHSGDLGYVDENGCLFIVGRFKRIIVNHAGFKISPFKIENVINENENVEKCCVVGVPDKENNRGSVPVANVVLKNQSDPEEVIEELQEDCQLRLKENHIPQGYRIVKDIPLTSVGKVDFRELEKQCEEEQEKGHQFTLKKINGGEKNER